MDNDIIEVIGLEGFLEEFGRDLFESFEHVATNKNIRL